MYVCLCTKVHYIQYLLTCILWGVSLQLMVIGVHGSHGESVPLPVEVERGHVSDCVMVHLLVMVVARVQETPHSCPGVTLRPVQVSNKIQNVFVCVFFFVLPLQHLNLIIPPLFVRWAP